MHLPSAERPCGAWIASGGQVWGISSHLTFTRSYQGAWALAPLSAALHKYLRQKVCCRILLSDVISFKLWLPCCRRRATHHKQPCRDPSQPCTWRPALLRQQCVSSAAQRWGHQPLQPEPGMCHAAGRTVVSWQDQAATFGESPSFLAARCMWAVHAASAMQHPPVILRLVLSKESVSLCLGMYSLS